MHHGIRHSVTTIRETCIASVFLNDECLSKMWKCALFLMRAEKKLMLVHVDLFFANEMNYFYLQSFIAFINVELLIAYTASPLNGRCVSYCFFSEDVLFFVLNVWAWVNVRSSALHTLVSNDWETLHGVSVAMPASANIKEIRCGMFSQLWNGSEGRRCLLCVTQEDW